MDDRIDLERALSNLTPKQERVVRLWMQGYTQAEIGCMMGVTQQAAGKIKRGAITIISGVIYD